MCPGILHFAPKGAWIGLKQEFYKHLAPHGATTFDRAFEEHRAFGANLPAACVFATSQ